MFDVIIYTIGEGIAFNIVLPIWALVLKLLGFM